MAHLRIRELPKQEMPRERLSTLGAGALSDSELIAILLSTGMKGMNVLDLSRNLVAKYGSLAALSRCSVQELQRTPGIGNAKGVQLAAAFELGHRLSRERITQQRMDSPELVYNLLGTEMRMLSKESLRVLVLDTKLNLRGVHHISLGSLNESIAHPREIFEPVIRYSAYAFILTHNHPSGDPSPSDADRRLTSRLGEISRMLQIQMLDHIIIGAPAEGRLPYFSFKEAGLL